MNKCGINNDGANDIAKYIKDNFTLHTLNMEDNFIGNKVFTIYLKRQKKHRDIRFK